MAAGHRIVRLNRHRATLRHQPPPTIEQVRRDDEHKPTDEQEFYQLLTYRGDVDLEAKLAEWERFYNLARPHGAHGGKTPDEALRERL